MTKEQIFDVIKANLVEVVPDLDPSSIHLQDHMKDLGANSIDRADVLIQTMECLGLNVRLHELSAMRDLQGLVDFLHQQQGA